MSFVSNCRNKFCSNQKTSTCTHKRKCYRVNARNHFDSLNNNTHNAFTCKSCASSKTLSSYCVCNHVCSTKAKGCSSNTEDYTSHILNTVPEVVSANFFFKFTSNFSVFVCVDKSKCVLFAVCDAWASIVCSFKIPVDSFFTRNVFSNHLLQFYSCKIAYAGVNLTLYNIYSTFHFRNCHVDNCTCLFISISCAC